MRIRSAYAIGSSQYAKRVGENGGLVNSNLIGVLDIPHVCSGTMTVEHAAVQVRLDRLQDM